MSQSPRESAGASLRRLWDPAAERFAAACRRGRRRAAAWVRWMRRRRRRRRSLGARGERAAAKHLRRARKMVVVETGARLGRGEIDLVAVDGDVVVFVEVKTRRSHHRGHPAEAVDARKQIQLTRIALQYLAKHDLLECSWRFDIVAVTWPDRASRPTIEHFAAAFSPQGVNSMYA